ncbi:F0F1 ATP synthase subunit delta [Helicobacter cinaedi PAGU611]|uniref:ATP synthase subunit delta n=1 Tax=Helicobacter cinaedi CCUG 18818 = ATCC BAA-847 TaxID=537971 RepID=A0AAI8MMW3_9HELI|nr:F0F1 ATP synthase subunit delta [Helicobacter cinaedi]EFR47619.1 putative ATP synthase F1, delta subunit [Helicobacter cinaedi CCUG 18818 = ATCC BAA-847]QOQ91435.1 F0F1 ATP synthase subunit delta [Helicobacter cinaedi]BAM11949.1 F0F1 ATP synthase subunit delta [Helicobacter cinaedi PAGU611]BAM32544.1 F0F1 ATP synthase subunit delta [Helicobacter cinaedi CCUG 18818 = ATCC BAA-847]BBB19545.1 ATP synthase delta chain [Helicobacter cinaedi]
MLNIISKKYTQALMDSGCDLDESLSILKAFSSVLKSKRVADIIASPFLSKTQKEEFLLDSLKNVDTKIQNFFRLIAQTDRILLIPYISNELEKRLLARKKEYAAVLVSKDELDNKTLERIQDSLAKKLGVKLSIKQELSGTDGIKLSVEDLGIEVSFSKDRFSSDLKNHILKAL